MIRPQRLALALVVALLGGAAALLGPSRAAEEAKDKIPAELMPAPFEVRHGYQLFQQKCTACHTTERIEMQGEKPLFDWQGLIGKMAAKDGAEIGDSERGFILMYLAWRKEAKADPERKQQYMTFLDRCESCHGIGIVYTRRFPRKNWPEIMRNMAARSSASQEQSDMIWAYIDRTITDLFGVE